jgi:gamma-D-glutamyl-L-lysine dipeptidyl-peptidase
MKNKYIFVSFLLLCFIVFHINSFAQKMVICVPVTDLRIEPVAAPNNLQLPTFYKNNPLQDSQLLLNEKVIALNEVNGWLEVVALEQKKCCGENSLAHKQGFIQANHAVAVNEFIRPNMVVKTQWTNIHCQPNEQSNIITQVSIGTQFLGKKLTSNWHKVNLSNGSFGFIKTSDIYYITQFIQETEQKLRVNLAEIAITFLNSPYGWGGRCACNSNIHEHQTSIDCSGFVNLVYRANGLQIPRDAHDQFKFCQKVRPEICGKNLKMGDLVFFANPERPEKIWHVLMYLGFGMLIESTGKPPAYKNRIIADIACLGKPIDQIKPGEICKSDVVYFGTCLSSTETIQRLRNGKII